MISSTRKVSSSPSSSPARRTERKYGAGSEGHPFVEVIDTTNNVLVREDSTEDHKQQQNPFEQDKSDSKQAAPGNKPTTYIPGAIAALAASGVYEQQAETAKTQNHKVNVYDNNQSMLQEDEDNSYDNPYLKHLYEKNEVIEEVDEFV